jgi:hypothetical protein
VSTKKKKRSAAAQQLIDTLLDEKKSGNVRRNSLGNAVIDTSEDQLESSLKLNTISKNIPGVDPIRQAELDEIERNRTVQIRRPNIEKPTPPPIPQKAQSRPIPPPTPPSQTAVKTGVQTAVQTGVQTLARTAVPTGVQSAAPQPPPVPEENTVRIDSNGPRSKDEAPFDPIDPPVPNKALDMSRTTEIHRPKGAWGQKHQPAGPTRALPSRQSSSNQGPLAVGSAFSSSEVGLKQSETLRLAQNRITELEHELDQMRKDGEELSSAAETLRRRVDELTSKLENSEAKASEGQRVYNEERQVMRGQLQGKDRENVELRNRIDEMEHRLESNFKKIRVRERELEHRLEIVKMENQSLVTSKDKMILDLKRQIDQLTHETEYSKQKSQELFGQYKEKQDTIRRVVRALRIALTILEGDEDNGVQLKKAE